MNHVQIEKPTLVFILFLFLFSCRPEQPAEVHRAFYHWKSTIDAEAIKAPLEKLNITKVYLRVFDIDWDANYGGPVPVGAITNPDSFPPVEEIIPTIFLTNRTFLKMQEAQTLELVDNMIDKLQHLLPGWEGLKEVQLDCDWTPASREKYFDFLRAFKRQSQKTISATIRLHQLRYPEQTGVPPADRGMLMFYNMGELTDWEESNSILNTDKARPYLQGDGRYGLPLDLALPLFSWGVVFRNDKMIRLIHKIPEGSLRDSSRFEGLEKNRFRVKKSTYLEGLYLYAGDKIRLEKIEAKKLEEAVKLNLPLFRGKDFTLSLYHLDTTFINALSYDQLEAVYQSFR